VTPFHGGNAGSNPAGDANILKKLFRLTVSPDGSKGEVHDRGHRVQSVAQPQFKIPHSEEDNRKLKTFHELVLQKRGGCFFLWSLRTLWCVFLYAESLDTPTGYHDTASLVSQSGMSGRG